MSAFRLQRILYVLTPMPSTQVEIGQRREGPAAFFFRPR